MRLCEDTCTHTHTHTHTCHLPPGTYRIVHAMYADTTCKREFLFSRQYRTKLRLCVCVFVCVCVCVCTHPECLSEKHR